MAVISHCLLPTSSGLNYILKTEYVLGLSETVGLSMNLKLSLGMRSNLAVAGMLPSFFRLICCVFDLPTLVLGNFIKIVL